MSRSRLQSGLSEGSLGEARRGFRVHVYSTVFDATSVADEASDVTRPANAANVVLLKIIVMFDVCKVNGTLDLWEYENRTR